MYVMLGVGGDCCFIYIYMYVCMYVYVCMYQPDLEQSGGVGRGGGWEEYAGGKSP